MKKIILHLSIFLLFVSVYSQEKVKYVVKSNKAGFDVTYTNSGGNTEQKKISSKEWSTDFVGRAGMFTSISAQSKNENANISVKIYFAGRVIEEADSSGDYIIASASGAIPDMQLYSSTTTFPNVYPYNKTFSGVVSVITYAPILEEPYMPTSKVIGKVKNNTVTIINKYNNGYYKIKYDGGQGYIWAGWFN